MLVGSDVVALVGTAKLIAGSSNPRAAIRGQVAVPPNIVMNSRRLIRSPRRCERGVSSDPSQNRLDCSDAWIIRLADCSEQLEPALVICLLHEVENSAGGKIG